MNLIPGFPICDSQKPYFITLYKVLNGVDRHSGYIHIMPCTEEIDADGIMDIFETLIKPTVSLLLSILSDQDPLFMSGKLQEWLHGNGVRHQVSSTYHPGSGGQTESKNHEIREMFAAAQ